MLFLSEVLLSALLCLRAVLASPVDAEQGIERRAQCNEDNVLRALQHRTPDSYTFCSSYISQPAATTVTVYTSTSTYTETFISEYTRHPAQLYNLQRWSSTQTPITYAKTSPSPSKVPGGACYYPSGGFCASPGNYKRAPETFEKRATTTPPPTTSSGVPSYLATVPPSRISSGCSCLSPPYATTVTASTYDYTQVTQTCTDYSPTSAVTTLPAFCAPTAQVNAPTVNSNANFTTVKAFTTPDKLSCCAACANVFNCVWWKFNFAKPFANGSGDPWQSGSCTYAFYTSYNPNTDWGNTGAICPNGKYSAIDPKYSFSGSENANALPGYNHGACGGPVGEFESSQDFGYPDGVYQNFVCPS